MKYIRISDKLATPHFLRLNSFGGLFIGKDSSWSEILLQQPISIRMESELVFRPNLCYHTGFDGFVSFGSAIAQVMQKVIQKSGACIMAVITYLQKWLPYLFILYLCVSIPQFLWCKVSFALSIATVPEKFLTDQDVASERLACSSIFIFTHY